MRGHQLRRACTNEMRANSHAGFTLLEVMVALAILGLALTAIFSSEAGAIRMAARTGKMGTAAMLARCKMLEIEEQVAKEGFPAVYSEGHDECCEEAVVDGFSCDWSINLVVLPDTMFAPEEEEEAEGMSASDNPRGEPETGLLGGDIPLGLGVGADPTSLLSGADTGLGAMAMQQVFPILKPAFEAQIRRATVTIHWQEGSGDKSFDVTQYLVAENGVPPDLGNQMGTGTTGTGATSTTTTTGPTSTTSTGFQGLFK